jgi:tetratricopeptide (TPR) repeat protein
MKRALAALTLLLGLPLSAAACLWDRDTPLDEARGLPEVVAVLTGRFARNPPLFYEMRLESVRDHLQSHPEDLAAYDDAGVACDRLGRGDEAISWMEKKRAQLDGLDAARPEVKEQLYRYHANLGTFLVHRWVRQGADRARIGEVRAARDEIAKALEINPDAHFGREKYQLRALEWIIDPPKLRGSLELPNLLGWEPHPMVDMGDPGRADEAVRGLAGLIVLGNAWESVDVFHALDVALQHDTLGFERSREGGRNTLAYLAWLRCRELIDAGRGSMLPDAPKGEALKAMLPKPNFVMAEKLLDPAFARLRAEAGAWHAARTAFMMGRLNEGRHPDTDPHFWDGYTERPAPRLPATSVPDAYNAWRRTRETIGLLVVLGVPTFLIVWLVGRSVRARRRKAPRADDWSAESAG